VAVGGGADVARSDGVTTVVFVMVGSGRSAGLSAAFIASITPHAPTPKRIDAPVATRIQNVLLRRCGGANACDCQRVPSQ
jgi:hypothetical protein